MQIEYKIAKIHPNSNRLLFQWLVPLTILCHLWHRSLSLKLSLTHIICYYFASAICITRYQAYVAYTAWALSRVVEEVFLYILDSMTNFGDSPISWQG